MKIKLILGASILLLVSVQVNASIINYTVIGDLSLLEGTDAYSLDGASFVWDINADTSLAHVGPFGQIGCCQQSAFYPSLTSKVTFTNRSNGAIDTTVVASLPMLQTVNADRASGEPDIFEIRHAQLTGEFETATMGGFFAAFDSSFYDEDGFATLPEQLNFADAVGAWALNRMCQELTYHFTQSILSLTGQCLYQQSPYPQPSSYSELL